MLQTYKQKKIGAKKGYDLMKKKSDALKKEFNKILLRLVESKSRMGTDYRDAQLSIAQATYAAGDFSRSVIEQVKSKSSVRVGVLFNNIAGVQMPTYDLKGDEDPGDDNSMLGLAGGGQAILACREKFKAFLKILVAIASLQTQFVVLDEALKTTNRRVNALEYILIPKI